MARLPDNLKIVTDNVEAVTQAVTNLSNLQLLVGIPDTNAGRSDGPISNAVIGYVQEFGMPDKNLPPRPFLLPTIKDMQREIIDQFKIIGENAIKGDSQRVMRLMEALGLKVSANVKRKITDGIPPPLKPSTIENRLRRTQAGRKTLKSLHGSDLGKWGATNLTPLIDTGALRNSITYVIHKKK